jgi:hypothetical protein
MSRFAQRRATHGDPAFLASVGSQLHVPHGSPNPADRSPGDHRTGNRASSMQHEPPHLSDLTAADHVSTPNTAHSVSPSHASRNKRATWNRSGQYTRGSVFHAGLAVLGITQSDPLEGGE